MITNFPISARRENDYFSYLVFFQHLNEYDKYHATINKKNNNNNKKLYYCSRTFSRMSSSQHDRKHFFFFFLFFFIFISISIQTFPIEVWYICTFSLYDDVVFFSLRLRRIYYLFTISAFKQMTVTQKFIGTMVMRKNIKYLRWCSSRLVLFFLSEKAVSLMFDSDSMYRKRIIQH